MVDIDVEEHGDVIIIAIKGEFYIESTEYAEKIWNEQIAKKPKVIGINCQAIKFIDSSAIGVLVKFLNVAMGVKVKLVFFEPSETILTIFKTARLSNFFHIMSKNKFEIDYL